MMIYNVTLDSISSRGTSIIVRPSRAGEALSVTEYNPKKKKKKKKKKSIYNNISFYIKLN